MIKTIIFDLGNVLIHVNHDKMLREIALLLNVPFSLVKEHFSVKNEAFESGSISFDEFLDPLSSEPISPLQKRALISAMNDSFSENREMLAILQTLKKQGKKLILLSNTNEIHFPFILRHYPFIHLFDHLVLSYEIKKIKPNPEIFLETIRLSGAQLIECFYIDDMIEHIQSARNLGIDAEQFINAQQLRQDLLKRMLFV